MLRLFEELGFKPKRCTWEITLACNLRCGHCGSRAGKPREDELDTAEALQVIADLVTLGCQQVTLAGGEPTLRKDWPELVEAFKRGGVHVAIITNGMTWSPKMTQRALDAGVDQVAFSIDGLQPAHDRIRGVEGAFNKVLDGIDACVAAGLRVGSVTHITRLNFADLEALHALLGEHGVRVWQVQQGVPTGNLSDEPELVLPNESMLELMPRLGAMARSGKLPKVFAADNIGYYGDDEQVLRGDSKAKVNFWVGCRAGLDVVGIESHGDVKGCLSLPSTLNGRTKFVEGNVRERSLVEIWNDANSFAYNRQFKPEDLGGNCKECEFGEVCRGGCTVTSVAHHGRPHNFPNCYYHLTR